MRRAGSARSNEKIAPSEWRAPSERSSALDVGIGDPELLEDAPLQRLHALGVGVAGLVVVAPQVQRAVHDEMGNVVSWCLLLFARLTPHGLAGQHDVAEERLLTRGIGQHVGRLVFPAVAFVERLHALSSDKATVSDLAFAPSAARAALRTNRPTPGRAFLHPGSIGTTSTLALAAILGVIGLDDAGHEVVANHVLGAQSYETDALDMAQR